ncbi:hypothetical protein BJV78DRAFT_719504 [Lactifluus subvellereus]|nr:hypothetical protein BJV78DRAFT_719504 [Lactifluus subvellereus]
MFTCSNCGTKLPPVTEAPGPQTNRKGLRTTPFSYPTQRSSWVSGVVVLIGCAPCRYLKPLESVSKKAASKRNGKKRKYTSLHVETHGPWAALAPAATSQSRIRRAADVNARAGWGRGDGVTTYRKSQHNAIDQSRLRSLYQFVESLDSLTPFDL